MLRVRSFMVMIIVMNFEVYERLAKPNNFKRKMIELIILTEDNRSLTHYYQQDYTHQLQAHYFRQYFEKSHIFNFR